MEDHSGTLYMRGNCIFPLALVDRGFRRAVATMVGIWKGSNTERFGGRTGTRSVKSTKGSTRCEASEGSAEDKGEESGELLGNPMEIAAAAPAGVEITLNCPVALEGEGITWP